MVAFVLFFNELSLRTIPPSEQKGKALALALISTLQHTKRIREDLSICSNGSIAKLPLCHDGSVVLASVLKGDDYRDHWRFVRGLENRAPFESTELLRGDYWLGASRAVGLGLAFENESAAISIADESDAMDVFLQYEIDLVDQNGTGNGTVAHEVVARNIGSAAGVAHWEQWLREKDIGPLPGFPDATRAKRKSILADGKKRRRWILPSGELLEWDYLHNEIEKYDSLGRHIGAFCPLTGRAIAGKGAVAGRTIEP